MLTLPQPIYRFLETGIYEPLAPKLTSDEIVQLIGKPAEILLADYHSRHLGITTWKYDTIHLTMTNRDGKEAISGVLWSATQRSFYKGEWSSLSNASLMEVEEYLEFYGIEYCKHIRKQVVSCGKKRQNRHTTSLIILEMQNGVRIAFCFGKVISISSIDLYRRE